MSGLRQGPANNTSQESKKNKESLSLSDDLTIKEEQDGLSASSGSSEKNTTTRRNHSGNMQSVGEVDWEHESQKIVKESGEQGLKKQEKTKENLEKRGCLLEQDATDKDSKRQKELMEEETDGVIDLSDPSSFDGDQRNKCFQYGVKLQAKGKQSRALDYFLACLTGMEDTKGFTFLPQCLHNIADIYYNKEEFEKAIQFIQAEKMYYETALIDSSVLQNKIEHFEKEDVSVDKEGVLTDALRADEYENLARMCLDKKQTQLSLEYQGKAIRLRQQVYGHNHPITKKSLDFFTVIYADVGKQQYTESMQKLSEQTPDGSTDQTSRPGSGILRKRKGSHQNSENRDRHVHFDESVRDNNDRHEQEEWVSRSLAWILFGLCMCVISGLLFYLYCRLNPMSSTCSAVRSELHYFYMMAKFTYYTWNPNTEVKFG